MKIFYLSFFIALVDQFSKFLIKGISFFGVEFKGMELNSSKTIIDDFLYFTFIENSGMAFGIPIEAKFFFSLLTVFLVFAICYYLYKIRNQNFITKLGVAFVLGGAIGNMIDRVFYGVIYDYAPIMFGKVVDFIDVSIFGYHWFVFNIADSSVTIGIAIMLLQSFKKNESESVTA